jgi:hypothetical protein
MMKIIQQITSFANSNSAPLLWFCAQHDTELIGIFGQRSGIFDRLLGFCGSLYQKPCLFIQAFVICPQPLDLCLVERSLQQHFIVMNSLFLASLTAFLDDLVRSFHS